jgi:hypothetical protein
MIMPDVDPILYPLPPDKQTDICAAMDTFRMAREAFELAGRIAVQREREAWAMVRKLLPELDDRELHYNWDKNELSVGKKIEPKPAGTQ